MNKWVGIGRLAKDPELKFTAGTGIAVATFTIAVDRNYVGQDGKREADFIPVVCWRKLAEHVANNLTKGRLVAVHGSIQTRSYKAQDGSNRYVTEIIADEVKFLDWGKDDKQHGNSNQQSMDEWIPVEGDDDIPF